MARFCHAPFDELKATRIRALAVRLTERANREEKTIEEAVILFTK